jgi:alpha-D-xyloside xylohydrolase
MGQTASNSVEIRLYPATDASFVGNEGEDTNYNYEKSMSSKIAFHWNDAKKEL